MAAKATIVSVSKCMKPAFCYSPEHDHYADTTQSRVAKLASGRDKVRLKAVNNSLSGKLGQGDIEDLKRKPASTTTNYPAYQHHLAYSHLVMSRLMDKCHSMGGQVLAMDTDSIFSTVNMEGVHWRFATEGKSVIFRMDVKAHGDLAMFGSKRYIMKLSKEYMTAHPMEDDDSMTKGYATAHHAWIYRYEDFYKLFEAPDFIDTRRDIKSTIDTNNSAMNDYVKGRWKSNPVQLSFEGLSEYCRADIKRVREGDLRSDGTQDSYSLVRDRRKAVSRAWNFQTLDGTVDNALGWEY